MDCSPRNREDAKTKPEEQESYYILINISSSIAKRDVKPSYGEDWLLKVLENGPAKLDNKMSQNLQAIRRSHKVYKKYHEKQQEEKLNREEKLDWDLLGRWATTIHICNCDYAIESHT